MLLVLCVDLDDDLGRKTGIPTPVIGADDVTEAAVALATADPEDSDVNVLFQGVNVHDELAAGGEAVEVAAVTGVDGSDVKANRAVGSGGRPRAGGAIDRRGSLGSRHHRRRAR